MRPSNRREGYLKVHSQNTLVHERVKFEIMYKLKKQGFEVWSEAIFVNGCRGDIVAIKEGTGWIIEVLNSETDAMFELKKDKYPEDFELVKIKVKGFKIEDFEI